MNCKECKPLISSYIDGESEDADVEGVRKHLEECAECRAELEVLEGIALAATGLARFEPDEDVVLAISSAVHECSLPPRRTQFGPVLDMDELADFLRVDKDTVGAYLAEIPCFELGGKLLFRRKSVEQWIRGREMNVGLRFTDAGVSGEALFCSTDKGGVRWSA